MKGYRVGSGFLLYVGRQFGRRLLGQCLSHSLYHLSTCLHFAPITISQTDHALFTRHWGAALLTYHSWWTEVRKQIGKQTSIAKNLAPISSWEENLMSTIWRRTSTIVGRHLLFGKTKRMKYRNGPGSFLPRTSRFFVMSPIPSGHNGKQYQASGMRSRSKNPSGNNFGPFQRGSGCRRQWADY